MSEMFQLNVVAMYFLYGLSFYTMGVAIALQHRSYSSFRLAGSLSLLAVFGLLHGVSEWGSVFIPVKVPNLMLFSTWKIIAFQRLLHSVSLFFLFIFGAKLIYDSRGRNLWWFVLPTAAFLGWFTQFTLFIPRLKTEELMHWLLISESWSRYILAFPAGVLTAYGLILQIPEVKTIADRSVLRNLWCAIVAFCLFALFSGIVVPQRIGLLSGLVNTESFHNLFGIPIEVFRTATALLATRCMTRMLTIFDLEKQRQVAEGKRLEAVFRERERFARDLHDDVIQRIYALGIELQIATKLIVKDQEGAVTKANAITERLNELIQAVRGYIQGLETRELEQEDLKALLFKMVEEFREQTGLNIELTFRGDPVNQQVFLPNDYKQQIRQIMREALNNIYHHAQATKVQVNVQGEGDNLIVTVEDNGKGMEIDKISLGTGGSRMGIRNMQDRARLLGGNLQVLPKQGQGTSIMLRVPLAKPQQGLTGVDNKQGEVSH